MMGGFFHCYYGKSTDLCIIFLHNKMKFFRTISSRISLSTSLFMIASVVLASSISIYILSQLMREKLTETAIVHLECIGDNIQTSMGTAESMGYTISRTITSDIRTGTISATRLQRLAQDVASIPGVSYCGILLDSSHFDNAVYDAPFYIEGQRHVHLATEPNVDFPTMVDMFNNWRHRGLGYWSRTTPNSKRDTSVVGSFICPIFCPDRRTTCGMMVIQISHHQIRRAANAIISEHAFCDVVNRQGEVVLSTRDTSIIDYPFVERLADLGCDRPDEVASMVLGDKSGSRVMRLEGKRGWYCFRSIPHTDWVLTLFIPQGDIYQSSFVLRFVLLGLGLIAMLIFAIVFTHNIVQRNLHPLKHLIDTTQEIAQGHFDTPLPQPERDDEISHLTQSFDKMRVELEAHIERGKADVVQRERINNEIRIAREIQSAMLPLPSGHHPYPESHDFHTLSKAAREVGGDLFHYHYTPNKLLFSIGDVSGKGVPAAILMSQIIMQLRYFSITSEKEHTRNMSLVNRAVCEDNAYDMFTTMMLIQLDLATGELVCCNAGHTPPIFIGPDGNATIIPMHPNLAIGVEPDYAYKKQTFTIEPGTTLVFFTDGVIECANPQKQLYGYERLRQLLQGANKRTPKEVVALVQHDVSRFADGEAQADDITLFVVHYKGPYGLDA